MEHRRIIKADSLRELGRKVVFDYEDFHQNCDRHFQDAQRTARKKIEEAEAEVDDIRENARREGREAGYQEGMKDANENIAKRVKAELADVIPKRLADLQRVLNQEIQAVADAREEWLTHWAKTAVELSAAIAERILRQKLAERPEARIEMLRELFELASAEEQLVLRLNPLDADLLETKDGRQVSDVIDIREIVRDETLQPGDCILESRKGRIDGRVSSQLDRVLQELGVKDESGDAR